MIPNLLVACGTLAYPRPSSTLVRRMCSDLMHILGHAAYRVARWVSRVRVYWWMTLGVQNLVTLAYRKPDSARTLTIFSSSRSRGSTCKLLSYISCTSPADAMLLKM